MRLLRPLVHLLALAPFLAMAWDVWRDALGADPVAELTHRSGDWALRMLLLALAVTPIRRITGFNALAKWRRLPGLYAFFYASVHLGIYLALDLGGYWPQIWDDVLKRPFITVGFLAWLGMLPLAATSTRAMMRRLGRRWAVLHRIVYAVGVLAVLHFLWLVKSDLREPALYAAILAVLLAARLPSVSGRLQRRADGASQRGE